MPMVATKSSSAYRLPGMDCVKNLRHVKSIAPRDNANGATSAKARHQSRSRNEGTLEISEDGVSLSGMNYRRKKVSMKEQLEQAILEIGGEPLNEAGFEYERPDRGFSTSKTPAPELHSPHAQ